MAGDHEDFYDLENMTDAELVHHVREQLAERPDIETEQLEIKASRGQLTIGGRIGTEAEYQVVERVLTDVIGIEIVNNEMIVDPLTRTEQSGAADEANARIYGSPRGQRGGADRTEDTAAHLLDDTAAEQYGTSDVGEAVERGYSYNPPDGPIQEGNWGREKH
ncbi:hypothetical protein BH23GEM9_BH23GEM9_35540 [soil metagenome]